MGKLTDIFKPAQNAGGKFSSSAEPSSWADTSTYKTPTANKSTNSGSRIDDAISRAVSAARDYTNVDKSTWGYDDGSAGKTERTTPAVKDNSVIGKKIGQGASSGASFAGATVTSKSQSESRRVFDYERPSEKLSDRARRNGIRNGEDYDNASDDQKRYVKTYYDTLDRTEITKPYLELERMIDDENTTEEAFIKKYEELMDYIDEELKAEGKQNGEMSMQYQALEKVKDDVNFLGRKYAATQATNEAAARSEALDESIYSIFAGVMAESDYGKKVDEGRKEASENARIKNWFNEHMANASEAQLSLAYYTLSEEGFAGVKELYNDYMGETLGAIDASKDFVEDLRNDSKGARFSEMSNAAWDSTLGGWLQNVKQLFTDTESDPTDRTLVGGHTASDAVDYMLRKELGAIADSEDFAAFGNEGFSRIKIDGAGGDWYNDAVKNATPFEKQFLGYMYISTDMDATAVQATWEAIKESEDGIWNEVRGANTLPNTSAMIEGDMYRRYTNLGGKEAPAWLRKEDGQKMGQVLWDAANSIIGQFPQIAGQTIGLLTAPITGPAAPVIGRVLGSAAMGAGAYGGAYKEARDPGASKGKSSGYAATNAAMEFITEYIFGGVGPMGGLLDNKLTTRVVSNIAGPIARTFAALGINTLSEGLEEYLGTTLDPVMRNLWLDEENKFELLSDDARYDFFMGAFSGLLLGNPSTELKTNLSHEKIGAALNRQGSTKKLIDTVRNSKIEPETTEQKKALDKAKEKAEEMFSGKQKENNMNAGELLEDAVEAGIDTSFLTNPETVSYTKEQITTEDMRAGAVSRLATLGGDPGLAEDVANLASGKTISAEAQEAIDKDPAAQQVVQELQGELNMDEDNALTIAARATTIRNAVEKINAAVTANNPDKVIMTPSQQYLADQGVGVADSQRIGAVIDKVKDGQTITLEEAKLVRMKSPPVMAALLDLLDIDLPENAGPKTVMEALNKKAAEVAQVKSMQAGVKQSIKSAEEVRRRNANGAKSTGVQAEGSAAAEGSVEMGAGESSVPTGAGATQAGKSGSLRKKNGSSQVGYNAPVRGPRSLKEFREQYKVVPVSKLTEEQRALQRRLARNGAGSVAFIQGANSFTYYLEEDGVYLIAIRADSKAPFKMEQYSDHETGHLWVKALSPEDRNAFLHLVSEAFGADFNKAFAQVKDFYVKKKLLPPDVSDDLVTEELYCFARGAQDFSTLPKKKDTVIVFNFAQYHDAIMEIEKLANLEAMALGDMSDPAVKANVESGNFNRTFYERQGYLDGDDAVQSDTKTDSNSEDEIIEIKTPKGETAKESYGMYADDIERVVDYFNGSHESNLFEARYHSFTYTIQRLSNGTYRAYVQSRERNGPFVPNITVGENYSSAEEATAAALEYCFAHESDEEWDKWTAVKGPKSKVNEYLEKRAEAKKTLDKLAGKKESTPAKAEKTTKSKKSPIPAKSDADELRERYEKKKERENKNFESGKSKKTKEQHEKKLAKLDAELQQQLEELSWFDEPIGRKNPDRLTVTPEAIARAEKLSEDVRNDLLSELQGLQTELKSDPAIAENEGYLRRVQAWFQKADAAIREANEEPAKVSVSPAQAEFNALLEELKADPSLEEDESFVERMNAATTRLMTEKEQAMAEKTAKLEAAEAKLAEQEAAEASGAQLLENDPEYKELTGKYRKQRASQLRRMNKNPNKSWDSYNAKLRELKDEYDYKVQQIKARLKREHNDIRFSGDVDIEEENNEQILYGGGPGRRSDVSGRGRVQAVAGGETDTREEAPADGRGTPKDLELARRRCEEVGILPRQFLEESDWTDEQREVVEKLYDAGFAGVVLYTSDPESKINWVGQSWFENGKPTVAIRVDSNKPAGKIAEHETWHLWLRCLKGDKSHGKHKDFVNFILREAFANRQLELMRIIQRYSEKKDADFRAIETEKGSKFGWSGNEIEENIQADIFEEIFCDLVSGQIFNGERLDDILDLIEDSGVLALAQGDYEDPNAQTLIRHKYHDVGYASEHNYDIAKAVLDQLRNFMFYSDSPLFSADVDIDSDYQADTDEDFDAEELMDRTDEMHTGLDEAQAWEINGRGNSLSYLSEDAYNARMDALMAEWEADHDNVEILQRMTDLQNEFDSMKAAKAEDEQPKKTKPKAKKTEKKPVISPKTEPVKEEAPAPEPAKEQPKTKPIIPPKAEPVKAAAFDVALNEVSGPVNVAGLTLGKAKDRVYHARMNLQKAANPDNAKIQAFTAQYEKLQQKIKEGGDDPARFNRVIEGQKEAPTKKAESKKPVIPPKSKTKTAPGTQTTAELKKPEMRRGESPVDVKGLGKKKAATKVTKERDKYEAWYQQERAKLDKQVDDKTLDEATYAKAWGKLVEQHNKDIQRYNDQLKRIGAEEAEVKEKATVIKDDTVTYDDKTGEWWKRIKNADSIQIRRLRSDRNTYDVRFTDSKGNTVVYSEVSPSRLEMALGEKQNGKAEAKALLAPAYEASAKSLGEWQTVANEKPAEKTYEKKVKPDRSNDNYGRKIPAKLSKYMEGSVVRDSEGRLLSVYRLGPANGVRNANPNAKFTVWSEKPSTMNILRGLNGAEAYDQVGKKSGDKIEAWLQELADHPGMSEANKNALRAKIAAEERKMREYTTHVTRLDPWREGYTNPKREDVIGNHTLLEGYVNIQNPLEINAKGKDMAWVNDVARKYVSDPANLAGELDVDGQALGDHDGLKVINVTVTPDDKTLGGGQLDRDTVYVTFHHNQGKSTYNTDPTDSELMQYSADTDLLDAYDKEAWATDPETGEIVGIQDLQGTRLSKGQAEYFAGSKSVAENGEVVDAVVPLWLSSDTFGFLAYDNTGRSDDGLSIFLSDDFLVGGSYAKHGDLDIDLVEYEKFLQKIADRMGVDISKLPNVGDLVNSINRMGPDNSDTAFRKLADMYNAAVDVLGAPERKITKFLSDLELTEEDTSAFNNLYGFYQERLYPLVEKLESYLSGASSFSRRALDPLIEVDSAFRLLGYDLDEGNYRDLGEVLNDIRDTLNKPLARLRVMERANHFSGETRGAITDLIANVNSLKEMIANAEAYNIPISLLHDAPQNVREAAMSDLVDRYTDFLAEAEEKVPEDLDDSFYALTSSIEGINFRVHELMSLYSAGNSKRAASAVDSFMRESYQLANDASSAMLTLPSSMWHTPEIKEISDSLTAIVRDVAGISKYVEQTYDAGKFDRSARAVRADGSEVKINDITDILPNSASWSVYARTTNPLVIDAEGAYWHEIDMSDNPDYVEWDENDNEYRQEPGFYGQVYATTRNLSNYAFDRGYDSLIIKNCVDVGGPGKDRARGLASNIYCVFNPEQIKSVNNLDPTESEMMNHSADPDTETGYAEGTLEDTILKVMHDKDEAHALEYLATVMSQYLQTGVLPKIDDERTLKIFQRNVTPAEHKYLTEKAGEYIQQFGRLEAGEKPARDVAFPRKTNDGNIRRVFRTAAEAKQTPDRVIDPILREALTNENGVYETITDKAAIAAADRDMRNKGFDQMLAEWEAKAEIGDGVGNRITKYDIAKAQMLYIEAAKTDIETAMKVLVELAEVGTTSGQVIQAMRLLKKMPSSYQLYYLKRVVNRLNKQYAKKIDAGKMKEIKIDRDLARAVLKAPDQEALDKAMEALIEDIAKNVPVTFADKWNAWRYLSMLGNPKTHIRNLVGNAIFVPAKFSKDLIAAGLEGMFIKDQSKRHTSLKGLLGGRANAEYRAEAEEDYKGIQKELQDGGKYNPTNEIMKARPIFSNKALEFLRKFNGEKLEQEDGMFLKFHYVNAMTNFLATQGMSVKELRSTPEGRKIMEAARLYAINEAQKATYRDASHAANALNQLKKNAGPMGILVEGVLPFTKTPINILKRGIEYSPIGLLDTVSRGAYKLKNGDISANEFIDGLASGLTGTGIMALGAWLASMGWLRGGGDDDDKQDDFENLQGYQSYSINIGGVNYTIDWMAPVALPLFVGAEIVKQMQKDGEFKLSDLYNSLLVIAEPFTQLSMLSGLNETIQSVKYDEHPLVSILGSNASGYITQTIPTLAAQIARSIPADRRMTYVDKNKDTLPVFQRWWQTNVLGKVPLLNSQRTPYIDAWGRKDTQSSFALRLLENMFSPGYANRIKTTEVDRELQSLADRVGTSVLMTVPDRTISFNNQEHHLTASQYQTYAKTRGDAAMTMLLDLFNSEGYQTGMSDSEKAYAVDAIKDYANVLGKQAVYPDYDPTTDNWAEKCDGDSTRVTNMAMLRAQAHELGVKTNSTAFHTVILNASYLTPVDQAYAIAQTLDLGNDAYVYETGKSSIKYAINSDDKDIIEEHYRQIFPAYYLPVAETDAWRNATIEERTKLLSKVRSDAKADAKAWLATIKAQQGAPLYVKK